MFPPLEAERSLTSVHAVGPGCRRGDRRVGWEGGRQRNENLVLPNTVENGVGSVRAATSNRHLPGASGPRAPSSPANGGAQDRPATARDHRGQHGLRRCRCDNRGARHRHHRGLRVPRVVLAAQRLSIVRRRRVHGNCVKIFRLLGRAKWMCFNNWTVCCVVPGRGEAQLILCCLHAPGGWARKWQRAVARSGNRRSALSWMRIAGAGLSFSVCGGCVVCTAAHTRVKCMHAACRRRCVPPRRMRMPQNEARNNGCSYMRCAPVASCSLQPPPPRRARASPPRAPRADAPPRAGERPRPREPQRPSPTEMRRPTETQ